MSEPEPEHVAVYRRVRRVFGLGNGVDMSIDGRRRSAAARDESSTPYGTGRDPRGMAEVLGDFTSTMGWESPLAQSELLAAWSELVGSETAAHSTPVGIEEGVLTVRCDSTAWAQQLRTMRVQVTTKIAERHPSAGIESVRFLGPDTPSWKRGPRAIPGRGPRDTYG
jgi:predicted nucleic acid-binding Zn ribbon protein